MMNTTPTTQKRLRYLHRTWRGVQTLLAVVLLLGVTGRAMADDRPQRKIEYNRDVRPILSENCLACHGPDAKHRKAELRLDVRDEAIKKQVVVPGDPQASELIERILTEDATLRMPPASSKKLLSMRQKDILRQWVAEGAEYQKHWAFEPIQKAAPPDIANVSNLVDRFIQGRLAEDGLTPSPLAARETLLRRVSLDLIGLPPTIQEIEEFLKASERDADAAYAELVDRLLASPHYGERWGRWWLDQARYADSNGYSIDAPRQIWAYRDWVINSFNTDLPFDEFTLHQLAGDLLPNATQSQRVATGFHRNTQINQEGGIDPEQFRIDSVFDRVATTGTVWLGLTIGCCQCHDHKFDPITARDYYALAGIFDNTKTGLFPIAPAGVVEAFDKAQKAIQNQEKLVKAAEADPKLKDRVPELKAERERLQKNSPPDYPKAHMLRENSNRDLPVAIRGDLRKPGEPAPRRFLQILAGESPVIFSQGSGRRQLAEAVTDPSTILTARVLVNRVWKHHFGQALVRTPSNFGVLGEVPTHPDLLEWLANSLVEDGWSLKSLHRKIVLSTTWQMSSHYSSAAFAMDGENRLLWRMNPRKLEVESLRDSLLAVTGELDRGLGGKSLDQMLETHRRTVYSTVSRNGDRFVSDEFLRLFDFPTPRSTSESRSVSTIPQQYLFMMNSAFMSDRAKALAERLQREIADDRGRIERAYLILYSRLPLAEEVTLALAFLGARINAGAQSTWQSYAQVLLSAHEFQQIR